jgi:hypothetical protein
MTLMQSFRIYACLKIGSFLLSIATENARKAVIELQKWIFLGRGSPGIAISSIFTDLVFTVHQRKLN